MVCFFLFLCCLISFSHTEHKVQSKDEVTFYVKSSTAYEVIHPGMTLQKFYICPWWALPAWDLLKSTSLLYYLVENYWTNKQILSYYCKLQSGGAPIYILKGKVFIIQSLICAIFILPFTWFWNLFSASCVGNIEKPFQDTSKFICTMPN